MFLYSKYGSFLDKNPLIWVVVDYTFKACSYEKSQTIYKDMNRCYVHMALILIDLGIPLSTSSIWTRFVNELIKQSVIIFLQAIKLIYIYSILISASYQLVKR